MSASVRERLQRVLAEPRQTRNRPERRAGAGGGDAARRFEPVARAAEELAAELSGLPEIRFTVAEEEVWIELYDRQLRFGIDGAADGFTAEEIDHSWIDGEMREERRSWPEAEDCIEAMIRYCASYARLARALRDTAPAPRD